MKKHLFIIILLVCTVYGYAQGVTVYQDGDIYSALKVAKIERKLLLVEFYAKWDYRSNWFNKMMNSSKAVTDVIENNFILYQFDTETPTGADFATRYRVTHYPYLLVFNRNGDVVYKIDKAYDPIDFIDILNNALMLQNGSVVWKLSQIDVAIENQDTHKANQLFDDLQTNVGNDIFNRHYWRLFDNDIVTHFQSNSYDLLTRFSKKFETDSTIVNNRITSIIINLLIPILIKSQQFDFQHFNMLKSEVLELHIHDAQVNLIIAMIENRNENKTLQYMNNCEALLNLIDEDKGYNIVLTLDFIATNGSSELKNRAQRIVEQQMQKSPLGSQINLLEHLLSKF